MVQAEYIRKLLAEVRKLSESDTWCQTVDKLEELCDSYDELAQESAEARKTLDYFISKSNQELLREFPCKIGDTLHFIDRDHGTITHKAEVSQFIIDGNGMYLLAASYDGLTGKYLPISSIGSIAFLDRDEAQRICIEIQKKLPPEIAE